MRDLEEGSVRGGGFAARASGEEPVQVPEGVRYRRVHLHAQRPRRLVHRRVALLRVRLGVELVAQPVASPRLERGGDDARRIAVQHEQRGPSRPERRVEVREGLEQEPKAVGADALGLDEPRVQHEHGLDRGGALARLHQRRVVVHAQAFSEPQDRSFGSHGFGGGNQRGGSGRGSDRETRAVRGVGGSTRAREREWREPEPSGDDRRGDSGSLRGIK